VQAERHPSAEFGAAEDPGEHALPRGVGWPQTATAPMYGGDAAEDLICGEGWIGVAKAVALGHDNRVVLNDPMRDQAAMAAEEYHVADADLCGVPTADF
jgi:hypothetical protein